MPGEELRLQDLWEDEDESVKLRHFDLVEHIKARYPRTSTPPLPRFLDASVSQLADCVSEHPEHWVASVQREAAAMLIEQDSASVEVLRG